MIVPALAEAGLDQTILDPRSTWADGAEYDATARKTGAAVHRQFRPVRPTTSMKACVRPRRPRQRPDFSGARLIWHAAPSWRNLDMGIWICISKGVEA